MNFRRKPKTLSRDQRDRAYTHIKRCDALFDGRREDGTPGTSRGDHEFAYQQVRLLALELLEKLS